MNSQNIDLLVIMHPIKQCGYLKVLELKHECWVIPASGSWWSQLLDIMWDKLITRRPDDFCSWLHLSSHSLFICGSPPIWWKWKHQQHTRAQPGSKKTKLIKSRKKLQFEYLLFMQRFRKFPQQVYSRPDLKLFFSSCLSQSLIQNHPWMPLLWNPVYG